MQQLPVFKYRRRNVQLTGREKKSIKKTRSALLWLVAVAAVLILAFGTAKYFCHVEQVYDNAMESTLSSGQKVLVNTIAYRTSSPKRGDLVVFRIGNSEFANTYIRRVIGVPGDTIRIEDGQIILNDETFVEEQDFPQIMDAGLAENTVTLGNEEYFVLGDNRNSSEDSRSAVIGNVSKNSMEGRVWFRVFPYSKLGLVS